MEKNREFFASKKQEVFKMIKKSKKVFGHLNSKREGEFR